MNNSVSPRYATESRQFRIRTLFGLTLLVGVFCSLYGLGAEFVAAGVSLTCGVILVRLFVLSDYQMHARVVGTLAGALLYLVSLWLPVIPDGHFRGWQAAWAVAEHTVQLQFRDVINARPWAFAGILAIDVGNLMAVILPPFVIWKPQRTSTVLTLIAVICSVRAWAFFITVGVNVAHPETGYWLWCVSLTVLLVARLVPFQWRFERHLESSGDQLSIGRSPT